MAFISKIEKVNKYSNTYFLFHNVNVANSISTAESHGLRALKIQRVSTIVLKPERK